MFRLWSICVFLLPISSVLAIRTWWVDDSCKQYFKDGDFDKMMDEVFHTANMGVNRMSRTKSQEPQAYDIFNTLFKYDPSSTNGNDQLAFRQFIDRWGPQYGLAGWTKQDTLSDANANRKASEVRIYCDEDARFELAPDTTPPVPGEVPNSQQTDETLKVWRDKINDIRLSGWRGCIKNSIRTDGKFTAATTYGGNQAPGPSANDSNENYERVSITLCKAGLTRTDRRDTVDSVKLNTKWASWISQQASAPPDNFRSITSMVMLHEMMHHKPYYTYDRCYEWANCVALTKVRAISNADTYSLFGIMMQGLDKKFTMDDKVKGTWNLDTTIPDTPMRKRRALFCPDGSNVNANLGSTCREFTA